MATVTTAVRFEDTGFRGWVGGETSISSVVWKSQGSSWHGLWQRFRARVMADSIPSLSDAQGLRTSWLSQYLLLHDVTLHVSSVLLHSLVYMSVFYGA